MRPLDRYLDESWLVEISGLSPDELAPSLGSVILALSSENVEKVPMYAKADVFLTMTQLTPSYVEILKTIFNALRDRRYVGLFLNLDMGMGKTHLLTLLLHLYISCTENPHTCADFLQEYRGRSCYDDSLAGNTVVLAFDMRTPGEVLNYLKLLARNLRRLGASRAVNVIENNIGKGKLPDPQELADSIPDHINVIVIIDELHHSLVYLREMELEKVKSALSFINSFLSYRRKHVDYRHSGLVVVVASARRDYERWNTVKSERDEELVAIADGFVEQLERVEALVRTEWLNVEEAKRILEKRLLLKAPFNTVFHGTFDRLLTRVLRADTDIPQAHHMRSLIKAMAVFALNSLRSNDKIVTPARFSGEVVKAFLLGHILGSKYLALYNEVEKEVRAPGGMLAVNTVFTLTITGDEMKLIDLVRMAKERTGPTTHAPLATELEVRSVLVDLGLSDVEIDEVVRDLGHHTGVHSVRLHDGSYAYFAIPVVNVTALYRSLIRRREQELLANRDALLEELFDHIGQLYYEGNEDNHVVVRTVSDVRDLEKKPLPEDKLHIYVYLDRSSLKQIDPSTQRVRGEVVESMRGRIKSFLLEKRAPNVAFILPGVDYDVLKDLALYVAVKHATSYVIDHYLVPLEKGQVREEDKVLYELMRIELSDIESEMGRRLNEALQSISKALSRSLSTIYAYNPLRGIVEEGSLNVLQEVSWREHRVPRDWVKVIDWIGNVISKNIADVRRVLIKQVKNVLKFVDDVSQAMLVLQGHVEESLRDSGRAVIYLDTRAYKYGDSVVYIPVDVVKEAVKIVKESVRQKHGNLRVHEDSVSVVLEIPKELLQPPGEPPEATRGAVGAAAPSVRRDIVRSLYDEIERRGRGVLILRLRFTREDIGSLRTFIGYVRKYISSWSIEEDRESR
mgnify:FL=1